MVKVKVLKKSGDSELYLCVASPMMNGYQSDTILQIDEESGNSHIFHMNDIREVHSEYIRENL